MDFPSSDQIALKFSRRWSLSKWQPHKLKD